MVSKANILDAMQYDLSPVEDPINKSSDPKWQFTYQFASRQPGDLWNGYSGWTATSQAEKRAVRDALDHIESFLNVSFVEVKGSRDPDLNFGKVDLPSGTSGQGGYQLATSGSDLAAYDGFAVYDGALDLTATPGTLLHEIGHALGLKHPFDGGTTLPDSQDNSKYTVMSYNTNPDTGEDSDAMMLYDIFALQDRWGANDSHARGNTIYRGPRTDTVDTIWDAGGRDTLDASARSKAVTLDLRAGHFSQFGDHQDVSIAFGTSIESAVGGSGSDRLTGNSTANTLAGHAGSDWLKGLGGDDTIRAGGGNDAVDGGVGDDRLLGQGGRDRFLGGAGDDVMRGGAGADAFIFARGDDKDLIADFRNDFDGLEFDGYRSLDWVLGRATEADDDVVFRLGGGDRLTVSHVALNEITDDILLA